MRGFGVTALDFALECQMDKLAVAIGMDPLEFRILNAYRDGDMKAHRREAKNCALIECAQVAAEKAHWPLRDEFRRMSSRQGGGAARAGRRRRPYAGAGAGRARGDGAASTPQRVSYERPAAAAACRTRHRAAAAKRTAATVGVARRFDARRAALLFSFRHQEALIMAKHRGRGVATINYPIGMNLGGDPSQALVHSNPTGKFTVALSSIDLGQGMKSVTRQICAETLGVPVEDVYVDTADSDTGPHCMGSFASRGTHRVGNAVMVAAREARAVMMEAAAEELEVDPGDLETDGKGSIRVKGAPHRSISVRDVAIAAQFRQGQHHFRTRHFSRAALRRRSGDRRDVAGDLLRPRLPDRRSRSRRRDRRCDGAEDDQRL